jgi:hypothetical protein
MRDLFRGFERVRVRQVQLPPERLPKPLRRLSPAIERFVGRTLVVHASKPPGA